MNVYALLYWLHEKEIKSSNNDYIRFRQKCVLSCRKITSCGISQNFHSRNSKVKLSEFGGRKEAWTEENDEGRQNEWTEENDEGKNRM